MLELLTELASDSAKLAKSADDDLNLFRRARRQRQEGKDTLNRIKQLRVVAQDLHSALQKRETQLRERAERVSARQNGGEEVDWSLAEQEEIVWKNVAMNIKRCQTLLYRMRQELLEYDTEAEPGLWRSVRMRFRMRFVHKDNLTKLHAELDEQFKALQVNWSSILLFISVDTQERNEANTRTVLDALAQIYQRISQLTPRAEEDGAVLNTLRPQLDDPTMPRLSSRSMESSSESRREHSRDRLERESLLRQTIDSGMSILNKYDPKGETQNQQTTLNDAHSETSSSNEEDYNQSSQQTQPHHLRGLSFASDWHSAIHEEEKESLDMLNRLITRYEQSADELVDSGSYVRAAERMTQAIKCANNRKDWYNVSFDHAHMEDKLAEIYRKQGNFHDALDVWEQMLPGRSLDPINLSMEQIKHYFLVCETYFEMWKRNREPDHLDAAFTRGRTCFTNREKHPLDAGSPTLSDVAELMTYISEARSDPERAEVYRSYTESMNRRESRADGMVATEMSKSNSANGHDEAELKEGEDATFALGLAIRHNEITRALFLLERYVDNIDINRPFGRQQTLLMVAFQYCRASNVIETLLARKADIHAADALGRTVLHRAAALGNAERVGLAINKDAKVEARDSNGMTPLMVCVAENDPHAVDVIHVLLENEVSRADVAATVGSNNWTALHFAAQNCKKPNAPTPGRPNATRAEGSVDADYKIRAVKLMELLCSPPYNAPIDAVANTGNTALSIVSEAGYYPAVEALLKLGANPNHRNRRGRSPLYLATNEKPTTPDFQNTVWALVSGGADTSDESSLPGNWTNGFKQLVEEELRRRAGGISTTTNLLADSKGKGRKRATSEMGGAKRINSTASTETQETTASKSTVWSKKLGLRKSR